ncbi:MAG: hypothetical protein OET08_06065, partial [Desulfuromonadales bacterium]|nr:hypothetical protein [Desulfuromonadales bacterium]
VVPMLLITRVVILAGCNMFEKYCRFFPVNSHIEIQSSFFGCRFAKDLFDVSATLGGWKLIGEFEHVQP